MIIDSIQFDENYPDIKQKQTKKQAKTLHTLKSDKYSKTGIQRNRQTKNQKANPSSPPSIVFTNY